MARHNPSFHDYLAERKVTGEQLLGVLQIMGLPGGALLIPLDAEDRDGLTFLSGLAAGHVPGLVIKFQATSATDTFSPIDRWRYRLDGPGAQLRRKRGVLSRVEAPYPVFTGLLETPLVDFSLSLMHLPAPELYRPWVLAMEALVSEADE